jgi:hypothetical protein
MQKSRSGLGCGLKSHKKKRKQDESCATRPELASPYCPSFPGGLFRVPMEILLIPWERLPDVLPGNNTMN